MKNYLQIAYFLIATDFCEIVALEDIEKKSRIDILSCISNTLEIYENRFKIELLIFPSWATKKKSYKINQGVYTHIKIKDNLTY